MRGERGEGGGEREHPEGLKRGKDLPQRGSSDQSARSVRQAQDDSSLLPLTSYFLLLTQDTLQLARILAKRLPRRRDGVESAPVPAPVDEYQAGRQNEYDPNGYEHRAVAPETEPDQGRTVERESGGRDDCKGPSE